MGDDGCMVVATALGSVMVGVSAWQFATDKGRYAFNRTLAKAFTDFRLYNVTEEGRHEYINISKTVRRSYGFDVSLRLPSGLTAEAMEKNLPGLSQAIGHEIEFVHKYGRHCFMRCGKPIPQKFEYRPARYRSTGLAVPVETSFGTVLINFQDETSCHLLIGGATRMGKSVFLRLLIAHLLTQMRGHIQIYVINHKITDTAPYRHIPQVPCVKTIPEARATLARVKSEVTRRAEMLEEVGDCVDIKQFRVKHPELPVNPIFVVIDEYGRFADDKDFQKDVQEIAETAGYLDVHLVVASQRPDAREVLNPRIKANMVTRIAFQTTDETNSKIIIDAPNAYHLQRIRGRAVLLDGLMTVVQVPYLSEDACEALVAPYRREPDATERSANSTESAEIPSFVERSDRETQLPKRRKPRRNR